MNTIRQTKRRLGEILVDEGLLTDDKIQEALKRQKATGELLGEALVKLGYVTEVDIARVIATQFGYPYLNVTRYQITKEAVALVPVELALEHQIIPLDKMGKALLLAVSGVVSPEVFEALQRQTGLRICPFVATSSQIVEMIKKHYPQKVKSK